MLTVEPQDFDSEIFGRPVYRLKIRASDKGLAEALSDLVRGWAGRDLRCAPVAFPRPTRRVPSRSNPGFRRIECLITMTCDLAA